MAHEPTYSTGGSMSEQVDPHRISDRIRALSALCNTFHELHGDECCTHCLDLRLIKDMRTEILDLRSKLRAVGKLGQADKMTCSGEP